MNYPDIEIYVRGQKPEDLLTWINGRVGIVSQQESKRDGKRTFALQVGDPAFEALLIDRVNGSFSSIWFNGTGLPWTSDVDCASDCALALDTEVRCQDPDSDAWISIQDGQRSCIDW